MAGGALSSCIKMPHRGSKGGASSKRGAQFSWSTEAFSPTWGVFRTPSVEMIHWSLLHPSTSWFDVRLF